MRYIDRFTALLFDMNSTFMFGEDRFDEGEDFHPAYRAAGGSRLASTDVTRFIRACYDGLSLDFENPDRYEDFPTLAEGFRRYSNPPEDELPYLVSAFAHHELGSIPESSSQVLRRLAQTHRLALVANIWSPKGPWLAEFRRAGIESVFRHAVFSSDFRCIKPSPALYREALRGVDAAPEKALFIGDSLRYDMEGAKRLGLSTLWVTPDPRPHPSVDRVLSSILELEAFPG